ncbi:hypothetical protein CBR_g50348 [Chara braunii]|nr:hypothetical protein CBR_g50348 [Chara braunii]|eukprot:GBG65309.1 hypothetical protein CBR_g50348 [Chara braunii]
MVKALEEKVYREVEQCMQAMHRVEEEAIAALRGVTEEIKNSGSLCNPRRGSQASTMAMDQRGVQTRQSDAADNLVRADISTAEPQTKQEGEMVVPGYVRGGNNQLGEGDVMMASSLSAPPTPRGVSRRRSRGREKSPQCTPKGAITRTELIQLLGKHTKEVGCRIDALNRDVKTLKDMVKTFHASRRSLDSKSKLKGGLSRTTRSLSNQRMPITIKNPSIPEQLLGRLVRQMNDCKAQSQKLGGQVSLMSKDMKENRRAVSSLRAVYKTLTKKKVPSASTIVKDYLAQEEQGTELRVPSNAEHDTKSRPPTIPKKSSGLKAAHPIPKTPGKGNLPLSYGVGRDVRLPLRPQEATYPSNTCRRKASRRVDDESDDSCSGTKICHHFTIMKETDSERRQTKPAEHPYRPSENQRWEHVAESPLANHHPSPLSHHPASIDFTFAPTATASAWDDIQKSSGFPQPPVQSPHFHHRHSPVSDWDHSSIQTSRKGSNHSAESSIGSGFGIHGQGGGERQAHDSEMERDSSEGQWGKSGRGSELERLSQQHDNSPSIHRHEAKHSPFGGSSSTEPRREARRRYASLLRRTEDRCNRLRELYDELSALDKH